MESILIEFDEKAAELKELVDRVKEYIGDDPVSKKVRDGFSSFYKNVAAYSDAMASEDLDKIASSAKTMAVYGQVIGLGLTQSSGSNEETKNIASELIKKSNEYRNLVENSPLEYKSLEIDVSTDKENDISSYNATRRNLKKLSDAHLEHDHRIKKLLNENESRINDLSGRIKKISNDVETELEKVSALYENTLLELESKKEQINEILGHASGRAIAGDFETSAAEEKSMANLLRYASLVFMAAIVAVVGYSFWETTTSNFQWQSSAFRVVLAIMLSIPAAYLARESAKHREQQYSHLQTSLDLKAINPYIASLPDNEQHKIKAEVARKLFAAKEASRSGSDTYPANFHEILVEILRKLETSKQDSKP